MDSSLLRLMGLVHYDTAGGRGVHIINLCGYALPYGFIQLTA